ncbi:MAG: hypothetical protein HY320_13440 [Armatimonadetes bacterium]|nr:hypothetical protein [Armatimonadota bacterium]
MTLQQWLLLLIASLAIGLLTLLWAICAGQFADQDRARMLPLLADERRGSGAARSRSPHGPHRPAVEGGSAVPLGAGKGRLTGILTLALLIFVAASLAVVITLAAQRAHGARGSQGTILRVMPEP